MKNFKAILSTTLLCSILIAGSALAAEFNLKIQTYTPPELSEYMFKFAKNLETMSGGRIKTQVFTSGELVSSSDTLKATAAGLIDIAQGSGYHYSELEGATIQAGMPMSWQSAVETEVLWFEMGFNELVAKTFEKQNVHYLGPIFLSPYAITTKEPVNSLDDLAKMKIRATSGPSKMFKKLGISAVYLKSEEMYLALSTGQIDGVLWGGATDYNGLKLMEAAPYYCQTYIMNPIVDALFINPATWNKLPADLKRIVEMAAHQASWDYQTWSMNGEYSLLKTNYGGKVTNLPAEDVVKLTAAAQELWEEEAAKSELSKQMVDKVKELLRNVGRLK